MTMQHTLLAVALASLFAAAPVAAEEYDVRNDRYTSVDEVLVTDAMVLVSGDIEVQGSGSAKVVQSQTSVDQLVSGDVNMSATLDGAGANVRGLVGANIASGVGNVQANDTALAALVLGSPDDLTMGHAEVISTQTVESNIGQATWENIYVAAVGDGALAGALGNIGVNVASGVGNAQGNAMAAVASTGGGAMMARADATQVSERDETTLEFLPFLTLNAALDGGALAGANGNIAVNIASGVGNVQHNGLSIASGL